LRPVVCTWTTPRSGSRLDGRTPSTKDVTSTVSPMYSGTRSACRCIRVGAGVLGDILDALAEDDGHRQSGGADEVGVSVALGVVAVLAERVGGHVEFGEGVEEPFGDRLPNLVAEGVADAEVFEENCPFSFG